MVLLELTLTSRMGLLALQNYTKLERDPSLDRGKKRKYMFKAFRVVDKVNMMHLKGHKRFKMVKCLVNYFTKATPKSYQIMN